jgi:hypothetical protein
MKLQTKFAVVIGALALATAPAMALASQPTNPGQGNGPKYTPAEKTPGPDASTPEKAKAYGVHCKGQSKKHVAGEKGTPFSQCVTAMAKVANNEKITPGQSLQGNEQETRQRRERHPVLALRERRRQAEERTAGRTELKARFSAPPHSAAGRGRCRSLALVLA